MASNFPELLSRLTLASSIAMGMVLLLRRPLRAQFGAGLAYQAWLIVPVMLMAAMLPALQGMPPPVIVVLDAVPGAGLGALITPRAASNWSAWLLLTWACGALGLAAAFVLEHRRFVRRLGPLSSLGWLQFAAAGAQGPLLLGLWRPKLVLPPDFEQRYTAEEQALVVTHEMVHARRGDPAVNVVVAALQCCFWFNPLVHAAALRCRVDQELACDAVVMAAHPGAAGPYASAMLKSQMAAETSATCHLQSNHPLKERMMNLQRTPLAHSRRIAGRLALFALMLGGLGATVLARADTAAAAGKGVLYDVNMTMTALGHASKPRLHVRDGETFRVEKGNDQQQWNGEYVLTATPEGKIYLRSKLSLNGKPMGEPNMLMDLGQTASLGISSEDGKASFRLDMVVTVLPEKQADQ